MAELFLGDDIAHRRPVVIKRMLPYLSEELDFVQMFLDEARIAAQLNHPNVVQLFELGQLDGCIFIAMEYVDGADLRTLALFEQKRGSTIPYTLTARIIADVCKGLHHAHQKVGLDGRPLGIIHRDVSPQNVVLSRGGEVKLLDFGIAKATAFMERSKPGIIKGKFLYLSPEQIAQEKLDHRSDLFALGAMLYEVTTGKSPFAKATSEAVLYAIRVEEPPPPHTLNAAYPRALSDIVMKCLRKDRDERYADAEEVRKDLESFLDTSATGLESSAVGNYVEDVLSRNGRGRSLRPLTAEDVRRQSLPEGRRTTPDAGILKTKAIRPAAQSLEPSRSGAKAPRPHLGADLPTPLEMPGPARLARWHQWAVGLWVLACLFVGGALAFWPLPPPDAVTDLPLGVTEGLLIESGPDAEDEARATALLRFEAPFGTRIFDPARDGWFSPQISYRLPPGLLRVRVTCVGSQTPTEVSIQLPAPKKSEKVVRVCQAG